MTTSKPQAYRHKTTGTIAWIGKPYENWREIADVLDCYPHSPILSSPHPLNNMRYTGPDDDIYHGDELSLWTVFPITITKLPDDWEPVELCQHCGREDEGYKPFPPKVPVPCRLCGVGFIGNCPHGSYSLTKEPTDE